MKKLFFIIFALFVAFGAMAQTKVTEVAPDGYIKSPQYFYIYGTTADTLTDADTLNYVFRVGGLETMDINFKLYSDFVSGSAGGTLVSYQSIDGVHYEATGDTITVDSLEADAMDSEVIDLVDFNYPYLKLTYIQSDTAVTVPKIYGIARRN